MSAVARQLWLPFGTANHFDLVHGRHHSSIAVATVVGTNRTTWKENLFAHDDAVSVACGLVGDSDLNVYLSQAGFRSKRLVANVECLPVLFVDLDTYKLPHLADMPVHELLDKVLEKHPWLPAPTLAFDSGRGHYFEWVFTKPLRKELLPRWQLVEQVLVELLMPFGADAAAKDAARVLRVVGSTNTKSGERVEGMQVGAPVAFEHMERLVLAHLPQPEQGFVPVVVEGSAIALPRRESFATPAQKKQHIVGYQLAYDRMHDCNVLAELRGSPRMTDCRHRLLYVYAVCGAWYWSGIKQAKDELHDFAGKHFARSDRYAAQRVKTVLDRMVQGKQGFSAIWQGHRVDRRYQLKNSTIIAALDITADEQGKLKTIIGPQERGKRREQRRRDKGMVNYAERTRTRLQAIIEGLERGKTQVSIAAELGISQQAVSRLIKQRPG